MCSLKEDIGIIKEDNEKWLKAKDDQEEINEILFKSLTKEKKNKAFGKYVINVDKDPLERNLTREKNLKIL